VAGILHGVDIIKYNGLQTRSGNVVTESAAGQAVVEEESAVGNVIFALVMIGIVAAILVAGVRSIKIQHEGKIGIVEAWGRFARVLTAGRYILWPWEHVVDELPLQIFEWETPSQKLVLKGGAPLTISAVIYYQIEHANRTPGAPPPPPHLIGTTPAPLGSPVYVARPGGRLVPAGAGVQVQNRAGLGIDALEPGARAQAQRRTRVSPTNRLMTRSTTLINRVLGRTTEQLDISHAAYRAKYVVHDWQEATRREAVAALQQVFSKVGVADDIIGNVNWQEVLGERVREHLQERTQRWGVQIIDVVFKDMQLNEMTLANLHAESRAEREGRVRAKEAENYQRIADILHLTPAQLLSWRQIEVMRDLAKSQQPRVMFTTDMMSRFSEMPPPQQVVMLPQGDPNAAQTNPDQRGYLGSEPPLPPLNAPRMADRSLGPGQPGGAGSSGIVAPSLQNIDQQ
jgi:regulator of protease activity HflC (stomatin/prohibitin superfamily)